MTFISGGNTNQFFDGNDQRVKLTEPNVVTYYLRSAVLGQVIAELDAAGTKTRGNIYLGAKLLARQAQNGSIVFEHDDPSGTKLRYTHAQLGNQTAGAAELDPLGADVYLSDPYLEDPGFEGRGEGFGEFGDVSDPSSGCAVDGLYAPCDIAFRLLHQGAAIEAPARLTKYNRERKRFEFFRAYADGYAGFLPTDARYYGNGLAFSASAANGSLNELAGIIELERAEPQNPQKACTFNLNIVNKSGLRLDKKAFQTIETRANKIFQTAGHNLVVNQPGKATDPQFNFTVTIFDAFPRNYPATASRFATTLAVTPLGRSSTEYPGLILPGDQAGISRSNIGSDRGYGRGVANNVANFANVVGGLSAHEYLAHFLLGSDDHSIDETGITAEIINYNGTSNDFIGAKAKEFLDQTCNTGRLP